MHFQQALDLINGFSLTQFKETNNTGQNKRQALEQESSQNFPKELGQYIDNFCPETVVNIKGVGHPISLLSQEEISWQMPGFKVDADTKVRNSNWQDNWFLIAVDGGDPVIVDLNDNADLSPVYSAMQTDEGWDFAIVADSIAQYVFCAKSIEHAMQFPGAKIIVDENFNLALPIAQWLFPLLYTYANAHYDEWASVFENYMD